MNPTSTVPSSVPVLPAVDPAPVTGSQPTAANLQGTQSRQVAGDIVPATPGTGQPGTFSTMRDPGAWASGQTTPGSPSPAVGSTVDVPVPLVSAGGQSQDSVRGPDGQGVLSTQWDASANLGRVTVTPAVNSADGSTVLSPGRVEGPYLTAGTGATARGVVGDDSASLSGYLNGNARVTGSTGSLTVYDNPQSGTDYQIAQQSPNVTGSVSGSAGLAGTVRLGGPGSPTVNAGVDFTAGGSARADQNGLVTGTTASVTPNVGLTVPVDQNGNAISARVSYPVNLLTGATTPTLRITGGGDRDGASGSLVATPDGVRIGFQTPTTLGGGALRTGSGNTGEPQFAPRTGVFDPTRTDNLRIYSESAPAGTQTDQLRSDAGGAVQYADRGDGGTEGYRLGYDPKQLVSDGRVSIMPISRTDAPGSPSIGDGTGAFLPGDPRAGGALPASIPMPERTDDGSIADPTGGGTPVAYAPAGSAVGGTPTPLFEQLAAQYGAPLTDPRNPFGAAPAPRSQATAGNQGLLLASDGDLDGVLAGQSPEDVLRQQNVVLGSGTRGGGQPLIVAQANPDGGQPIYRFAPGTPLQGYEVTPDSLGVLDAINRGQVTFSTIQAPADQFAPIPGSTSAPYFDPSLFGGDSAAGTVPGAQPTTGSSGQQQNEQQGQPAQSSIPPNLVRAPIFAGSGAVASYFLNRSINPSLTLAQFLPQGVRGGVADLFVGGLLPPISGFDPLTGALLSGARGAAIGQGLSVASRRVVNPALNAVSDYRNPQSAPANIRSDFAVGTGRVELPLTDPIRTSPSANASLNTDTPVRVTVGTIGETPAPGQPGTSINRNTLFTTEPTGGSGPGQRLGQEFLPDGPRTALPEGWTTGTLPSRQAPLQQRQLEATADRLGLGSQFPDREAPLTVFDLTNAPPAVRQQVQRMTDATVAGINFAVPLANAAVDALLQATGQQNNQALSTLAHGVATGIGVGLPISIAEGKFVGGAFLHPTWQSIFADTAARAILSAAPAPVQQAVADACRDDNPVIDALGQFACSVGANPNQQPPTPPTNPPASTGGAVVTNGLPPNLANGGVAFAPAGGTATGSVQPAPAAEQAPDPETVRLRQAIRDDWARAEAQAWGPVKPQGANIGAVPDIRNQAAVRQWLIDQARRNGVDVSSQVNAELPPMPAAAPVPAYRPAPATVSPSVPYYPAAPAPAPAPAPSITVTGNAALPPSGGTLPQQAGSPLDGLTLTMNGGVGNSTSGTVPVTPSSNPVRDAVDGAVRWWNDANQAAQKRAESIPTQVQPVGGILGLGVREYRVRFPSSAGVYSPDGVLTAVTSGNPPRSIDRLLLVPTRSPLIPGAPAGGPVFVPAL